MRKIEPSLLSVVLALALLTAPCMEFPALGQPEPDIKKATSSDAAPETEESEEPETDDTKENDTSDGLTSEKLEEDVTEGNEDIHGNTNSGDTSDREFPDEDIKDEDITDEDIVNEDTQLPTKAAYHLLTGSKQIATGSDADEPLEVVQILSAGSRDVIAVRQEQAEDTLSSLLELDSYRTYSIAAVKLSDNSRALYPIRYELDLLGQADMGLVLIPGFIEAPDEVSIPPELESAVLPVFLYDPDSPCEIPAVDFDVVTDYTLIGQTDTKDTLLKSDLLNQDIYFDLGDGYTWGTRMNWDLSGVLFGTPGSYKAYAVSPQEKGILLPADFPPIAFDIIIQADGKLTLGPPDFKSAHLEIRWTKETPDIQRFRRYYAVGDGDWQEDVDGDFMHIHTQNMYVYYYDVDYFDTPYYFQLSYDGEDSDILKVYMSEDKMYYEYYDGDRDGGDRGDQEPPTLGQPAPTDPPTSGTRPPVTSVPGTSAPETSAPETSAPETTAPETTAPETTAPDETLPTETQPSEDSSGGSGGHSSGSGSRPSGHGGSGTGGPGAVLSSEAETRSLVIAPEASVYAAYGTQSAVTGPETEHLPAPKETAPSSSPGISPGMEEETDDYVVLSGNRIKKYLEHNPGQPVTVTKHKIRLSVPSDTGLFSDMDGQSLFRVELLALSEDTVSVGLFMDGVPLTSLPPLTLTIPWTGNREETVRLVAESDGTVLGETQVTDGHLTFTVTQTGTFTLQEAPLLTEADSGSTVTIKPDGSGDPLPDTPVSVPQEQTAQAGIPWVPILCAALVLALSALCFWRWTNSKKEQEGGSV